MRRRSTLLVSTLSLLLLATGAIGASASTAPAGTQLPLTGFRDMVADPVHGHVFITGLRTDNVVLVRNNDGSAAAALTGETGAGSMVLSNGTLYVARCGPGVIDEFDTATLTKTGSISAPSIGGACALALASGRFWYSDGSDAASFGDLTSVPADGSSGETQTSISVYGAQLASSPAHPDWLVVGDSLSAPTIKVFDVSEDPAAPTQLVSKNGLGGAQALDQLTISPDGGTLYLAAPGNDATTAFGLPGLGTEVGNYPLRATPLAVAVSPDGTKVAGGGIPAGGNAVSLFDVGSSAAKLSYNIGDERVRYGGLVFTGDGSRLFAVTENGNNDVLLHVFSTSPLKAGSLSLKASARTITHGGSVTLTAHLGTSSSNKTVSLYRTPTGGGTPTLIHAGAVNSHHDLVVRLKPADNEVYSAVWSGDATHNEADSSNVRVNVRVAMKVTHVGGYRTSHGYRLYHYTNACHSSSHRGCPTYVAFSSPLQISSLLKYSIQAKVGKRWRTIGSGSPVTGTNGKLALIVIYSGRGVIGYDQRVRFTASADATHLGNASNWAYFRITR